MQFSSAIAPTSTLDNLVRRYLAKFYEPRPAFDMNVARAVIFGFFIYKLLSRDFAFFGYVPAVVFQHYPVHIYSPSTYVVITGVQVLMDLFIFHWVHWFLPLPGPAVLSGIQIATICACLLVVLFGRGPRRVFVITAYVGVLYLWGFVFRSGQEIDAMFLMQGCALVYCFSEHREANIFGLGALAAEPPTAAAGWTYSAFLMIFVLYYFGSGMNKISDLYPNAWFHYRLIESIEYARERFLAGHYRAIPALFDYLRGQYWLNYVGPPLVYVSHLFMPLLFVWRSQLLKAAIFYAAFHFLAIGVGISFVANFIAWLIFVPYARAYRRRPGAPPLTAPAAT